LKPKTIRVTSLERMVIFDCFFTSHFFLWSYVSTIAVMMALIIMIAGFWLFVLTMVQNRFASRVVEIQQEQMVVTGGV